MVTIHGFKHYCVQSARQIRFKGLRDIVGSEHLLKAYIREAAEVEKAGSSRADWPSRARYLRVSLKTKPFAF